MAKFVVTRRRLLRSIGLVTIASPVLAACAAAPPAPTAAPAAPTTAAPTAAPSSAPTATPAPAAKPAAAGGATSMSLAVYTDRDWMPKWANKWADQAGVTLKIDPIAYGDMNTKQLAQLAGGTMEDVTYAGNKWLRYSAFKGAFSPIDDYAKAKPFDKDDMIPSAVDGGHFEGKQYGLPTEWNPGNTNVIFYNKDMCQEKGVAEPTDTMSHNDYTEWSVKMTDSAKGIYGTNIFPGTYYDFGDWVRDLGGDVMSDDGTKFLFGNDPKNREVAQWLTDFRVKYKAAPDRAGMAVEQLFPTGKVASIAGNAVSVVSYFQQVGDKFKMGVALGPVGPEGLRGYDSFSAHWLTYSKSKEPEKAYDLMLFLTSKDAAKDALITNGAVPARFSVWRDPEANKISDVFAKVADWVEKSKSKGPFPLPANLRYTELETTFENVGFAMFYGEMPFDEGLKKTQEECQKIMDQPRG